jgi:sterol 3beta-glucosyltransferase
VTAGSRGDVQPYVALGLALRDAGHDVTVATHETFREFVVRRGLGFQPVAGDPRGILAAVPMDRWLASGRRRHLLAAAGEIVQAARPLVEAMRADFARAVEGADLVVYSAVAAACGEMSARAGTPAVAAFLQPLHATRESWETIWPLPGLAWLTQRIVGGSFNARPALYGYSPLVGPTPSDWGSAVAVTGYWVLGPEPGWEPPAVLVDFLGSGPPPVAVGFGSMTPQRAARLTGVVLDALQRSGQRGILLGGWGRFGDGPLPDSVLQLDECPHEWLFPRTLAVVHHGGSGTTGAALRGGTPSIVVPLGFDQPYWARRVAALGVGPRGVARRRLTAVWLAGAIRQAVEDRAMRARAAALGARLQAERGTETARHYLNLWQRSSSYPDA